MAREPDPWESSVLDDEIVKLLKRSGFTEVFIKRQKVWDGSLRAVGLCEPPENLWHLTVTHERKRRKRRGARYPTWDELMYARVELLPENVNFVLFPSNGDLTIHIKEQR